VNLSSVICWDLRENTFSSNLGANSRWYEVVRIASLNISWGLDRAWLGISSDSKIVGFKRDWKISGCCSWTRRRNCNSIAFHEYEWEQLDSPNSCAQGEIQKGRALNCLLPRGTFSTTPIEHNKTEEFGTFLCHFDSYRLFGTALLILDTHRGQLSVLNDVLTFPSCSLQPWSPLDKSFFLPLKY
jgi:hypothetical protein